MRPSLSSLRHRAASGTGLAEVRELEQRVEVLAEAIEENADLELPLAALVTDLERSLVGVLERRLRLLGLDDPGSPGRL